MECTSESWFVKRWRKERGSGKKRLVNLKNDKGWWIRTKTDGFGQRLVNLDTNWWILSKVDECGQRLMNLVKAWWILTKVGEFDKDWWIWAKVDEFGSNFDKGWWIWTKTYEFGQRLVNLDSPYSGFSSILSSSRCSPSVYCIARNHWFA